MTHLLCSIYALVIIVLGIVLPASNAITHFTHDHVYYVEVSRYRFSMQCRVQNGSPGSTRFYGPVHLRRYWSVPVSTGPYILGRPVKFSNSQDADNLHRMPIPFQ